MEHDMRSGSCGWLVLDHPADVMIEVTGETFLDLCRNAARGLNHFLGEIVPEEPAQSERLKIEGDTLEEQLVNLLRELLFHFVRTSTLITNLALIYHDDKVLLFDAFFEPAKVGPNSLEVKGITYHGLSVEKNSQGYVARLVFDV